MTRSRFRLFTVPVVCGLLLLTACSPGEPVAQTCQRLTVVQEEIAQFETSPTGDPAQRVETVRGFALELDVIRDDAGNAQLAFAADAIAEMYWTIADVALANPLLNSMELIHEVDELLDTDRINEANETYLQVCEVS